MAKAWIDGKPAALESAVGEAARLLAASHCPLIAGLGTDVAGARAAIVLAERIGAVVDHMHSDVLFRDLAVLRGAGIMATTPSEAQLRADTLMLVGPNVEHAWQGLPGWHGRAVWLCPGRTAMAATRDDKTRIIGHEPDQLPSVLAALRARLAGRPAGKTGILAKTIEELAKLLKAAQYGVAVWSAAALDALVIEMLCGIVDDLNAETRFAGFSDPPGDNVVGVLQTCGWMTGFPMRTGFGRGYPEHDPWRFDGKRMVTSGEADCVMWISSYRAAEPAWDRGPPVIALTTGAAPLRTGAAIQIEVGHPGVDHDGVEHHPVLATLVSMPATQPSGTITVADAIGRIVAALPAVEAAP